MSSWTTPDLIGGRSGIYFFFLFFYLCLILIFTSGMAFRKTRAGFGSAIFSPDGHNLVMEGPPFSSQSGLFQIKPDGSELRFLTNPGSDYYDNDPSYAHNQPWLVFKRATAKNKNNTSSIFMLKNDREVQLTDGKYLDMRPVFSVDDKRIYFFRSFSTVFSIKTDGSDLKQEQNYERGLFFTIIPPGQKSPLLSPDRKSKIEAKTGKVYLQNLNSNKRKEIVRVKTRGFQSFYFSPDGRQILFSTGNEYESGRLWLINSDGSFLKEISPVITAALKRQKKDAVRKFPYFFSVAKIKNAHPAKRNNPPIGVTAPHTRTPESERI